MPDIIARGRTPDEAIAEYVHLQRIAGVWVPPEPVVEQDAAWFTARAPSLSSSPEGR